MNQIFKMEVVKTNSKIQGHWTPEIDALLKKSMDAIDTRDIVTFDSLAIKIMSKEEKWTPETFNKYFVFLEGIKANIDNFIVHKFAIIPSLNKSQEKIAFSFLGIGISIIRVTKKNGLFAFEIGGQGEIGDDIFNIDTTQFMVAESFVKKMNDIVLEALNSDRTLLNVNNKFMIGKNENGQFEVFNTIEGLAALNKENQE